MSKERDVISYTSNQDGKPCRDITGMVSGRLTAVKPCKAPKNVTTRNQYWMCRCECGAKYKAQGRHIVNENVTRCSDCR